MLGYMRKFALKNDDKIKRCPGWSTGKDNGCPGYLFWPIITPMVDHGIPWWAIKLMPMKCPECGIWALPHIGIRLFFWRIKFRCSIWLHKLQHKK